jgi:hypothetical protein
MYSEVKDITNMVNFINMSLIFKKANIKTPIIYAKNFDLGFFLLEDFGDDLYYVLINNNPNLINKLYKKAIDTIIKLQLISEPNIVPNFDLDKISWELSFFKDWYLKVYLNYDCTDIDNEEIKKVFDYITNQILTQPYVFTHRDFHTRNLLQTSTPIDGIDRIGVIDMQSMNYGPYTYDLSSLLYDAYIILDDNKRNELLKYYWESIKDKSIPGLELINFENFYLNFELLSLERNLKLSGLFVRLGYRDLKYNFLNYIHTVINYIINISKKYDKLKPLSIIIEKAQLQNKKNLPCLLLAAGNGIRLKPLTNQIPKPLLEIKNKNIFYNYKVSTSNIAFK